MHSKYWKNLDTNKGIDILSTTENVYSLLYFLSFHASATAFATLSCTCWSSTESMFVIVGFVLEAMARDAAVSFRE